MIAEVLDLGPLAELRDVLDRQRMQLEDITQQRDAVLARLVQIKPEQGAVAQRGLDRCRVGRTDDPSSRMSFPSTAVSSQARRIVATPARSEPMPQW